MPPESKINPEDEEVPSHTKSELSQKIEKLKASISKLTQERENLPQPLFWSLFNSQINEMRKSKEDLRRINELLSNLD